MPGNHERSAIPFPLLAEHPRIHVFDRPRTFTAECGGVRVALAGFPFERHGVRGAFRMRLDQTGWARTDADVRLLCVHQCVEGATVGAQHYTFRSGDDVVRAADVPAPFAAILAGHIHRHQVLTTDLRGRALPTPVLYPGSIERTSFAERGEEKGYVLLEVAPGDEPGGVLRRWTFTPLPARPMVIEEIQAGGADGAAVRGMLTAIFRRMPADAVLQVRVRGVLAPAGLAALGAAAVRALAPATMNVELRLVDVERPGRSP